MTKWLTNKSFSGVQFQWTILIVSNVTGVSLGHEYTFRAMSLSMQ